jgi:large subunit ribosomal protein L10
MKKEQKAAVVDELSKELSDSDAIFAVDYRGISVPQAAELREGLRDADTRFRVVKNRLTLLAADKAGTESIKEHLEGPTAIAFVKGDPALAAKTIFRLGREWEILEYKGGLMDGEVLDPDTFGEIARLPGRDQMNAQFAGIVASPLTGLVRGLGSMVQGLALQLQAMADQGLVTGEAPAEAPAEESDETPAEEQEAPKEETPKEDESPAGDGDEKDSGDEGADAEDGSNDGAAEAPKAESEPDPEPEQSPEEEPSEEEAPAGEDAGEEAEAKETTEGDAEMGEAAEEAQETSEDSNDENKEDDS